jgi:hypothetical protein
VLPSLEPRLEVPPLIVAEIWLIDSVEGTQLIYKSPNEIPAIPDPVVTGKFTPGQNITVRCVFESFGHGYGYLNCSCAGQTGDERPWNSWAIDFHTEEWTFVNMPNAISTVEVVCVRSVGGTRYETDRVSVNILPSVLAVPTLITLEHSALSMSEGKVVLPQAITLNGKLTRTDTGAGLGGETVEIWRCLNGELTWTKLVELTTDANGNYSTFYNLNYCGVHEFKAIFRGRDVLEYSEAYMQIDATNYVAETIPYPLNQWTDFVTHPVGGVWQKKYGVIGQDFTRKAEGNCSIHFVMALDQTGGYDEIAFALDNSINCNYYPFLHLFITGYNPTTLKTLRLELVDVNNQAMFTLLPIITDFGQLPDGLVFKCQPSSEQWSEATPGATNVFRWDAVKKLIIKVWGEGFKTDPYEDDLWIDAPHFTYSVAGTRALKVKVLDKNTLEPLAGATCVYGYPAYLPAGPGGEVRAEWVQARAKNTDVNGLTQWTELAPGLYGIYVTKQGYKHYEAYVDMTTADGDLISNPILLEAGYEPPPGGEIPWSEILIAAGLIGAVLLMTEALSEL